MNDKLKRFGAIAFGILLVAAAAGPAAAALTYDSETTNSASTSDLTGGETVSDIDNESVYQNIQFTADNATSSGLTNPEEAFTMRVMVNDSENADDGFTFYETTATATVVDATNGTYKYNLSNAELFDDLPRETGENVSVDITTVFNETESDEESATITVTADNGNDRVVRVVTDDDVANDSSVETTNESRTLRSDLDFATVESADVSISNNTTVTYVLANDTVASKYTTAYDVATFDSGDYIWSMTASVEGEPVMVFDSEAGATRDAGLFTGGFTSDDSYAVYDNSGGVSGSAAELEIVPRGDHDDEAAIDVESSGNRALGFYANLKHFGFDAARSAGLGVGP